MSPPPTRTRVRSACALAVFAVAATAGCASTSLTPPLALCTRGPALAGCRDPRDAERLLQSVDHEVLASEEPMTGAQETRVLTMATGVGPDRIVFRAKFRAASADVGSSSARKELAAHALQQLVLDPLDWVVPPATFACLPLDAFRARIDDDAEPTFRGAPCVAGVLSWWIEGGRSLEDAHEVGILAQAWPLDVALFRHLPSYRASIADLNLLAHVATHGDSHVHQFVVTGDRQTARVWLVDNSMAFDGYVNRDLVHGPWDWSNLHVPEVRRATVERLRDALEAGHLDALATVAQRRLIDGRLVPVAPEPPDGQRQHGVRWKGAELQVGLTRSEIARLRRRVRQVVAKLESGRLRTF